eukprot:4932317-Pyramimonas_sp.AAC.1
MPRIEGDLAASSTAQPPAKPGGKGAVGSQTWRPSIPEPPPNLTEFIRANVSDSPPVDQSHQKSSVRRWGDARHAEDSATRDRPAEAHSSIDEAKAASAEE